MFHWPRGWPVLALLMPLFLVGCSSGSIPERFGFGKRSPDEFQVVRRAPLVVPPDYRLRPPQPGVEGQATAQPSAGAFEALTGQSPTVTPSMSAAEQSLVGATPGQPLPDIRRVLAQEDSQLAVLDRGTFLFILSWQRNAFTRPADTIDPVLESQRLRSAGVVETERRGSTPIGP
jgi:Protein of unknown function (DUF3035)